MTIKQTLIDTLPAAYEAVASFTGVTPKGRAQGPDLSHWDGAFDPNLAIQRIDFAFMKITEGSMRVDAMIEEIWSGVKNVEARGAYHYQRSGMSWVAQANHFLTIAAKYDFHFYALDVESKNNKLNDTFFADTWRILNRWRDLAPQKTIMLYTNKDIYQNYLYPAIKRLYGSQGVQFLNDLPLWYAQYWKIPSVDKDPSLPRQRRSWDFWQIADTGKASDWGTASATDVNVYNGTPDQLRARLGIDVTQPPSP